jgi:hypothetical protein
MVRTDIDIRRASACHTLAVQLYGAWADFYRVPERDFSLLPRATKELWIDRALEAIEAVGPSRAKVLARISAETPWGDPVLDARD